jgi:hypothetical protein
MRIYADTSVFGGVFDDEFSSPSTEFFKEVREQRFHLVSSAVVEREIMFAPEAVREFFASMLLLAEVVEVTPGVLDLRIVSWNFKHIVHFQKVPGYNAVNVLHGHKEIDILSRP